MAETTRYQVNGIFLAVSSSRPARPLHPPVVLLAGTGNGAADWDSVAADLSRDRAVHAVDLRGHGHSEWTGTYSIDSMATDFAAVLPEIGSEVDVIGHSLGGLVACRAFAADPGGLRRLVLEDVGMPYPRAPETPARPDGDLDFDWAVVEQIRPEIDRPAAHWPATLARIIAPTLVIGGGPDSFVPQTKVLELVARLSQGRHLTIAAGHNIHSTKPPEFIQAVRGFLDA
ncbi:MAG: alpha/beta hydrolase [Propionibacteriaceae bacterium]|jgi:pimeloyl-ACP methyl ester carboxylesterase|nr:alpha/beta hydrolase [Propionibacteriaceae bacterium]